MQPSPVLRNIHGASVWSSCYGLRWDLRGSSTGRVHGDKTTPSMIRSSSRRIAPRGARGMCADARFRRPLHGLWRIHDHSIVRSNNLGISPETTARADGHGLLMLFITCLTSGYSVLLRPCAPRVPPAALKGMERTFAWTRHTCQLETSADHRNTRVSRETR